MRSWLLLALLAGGIAVAARGQEPPATVQAAPRGGQPIEPLSGFVANRGQWPAEVRYFASRGGIDATLLDDAIVLRPRADLETGEWPRPLTLRFPAPQALEERDALPTVHHFILAEGSASNVPGFERIVYRGVAPGIDLVVRADGDCFAYDLHVVPGADLDAFGLQVEGADGHELAANGWLVSSSEQWRVEQRIGAAWEVNESGAKLPIESRFRIGESTGAGMSLGFAVSGRKVSRPLVIDPSLVWATYVGGTAQELLEDTDVTADGSVYLAVKSMSTGPTTSGAFITVKPPGSNAWAGKVSPDGSTLEWATFLGGSDTEGVAGVEVDADGSVVVVGDTWSEDFPITPGTVQPAFGGSNDMFVSRLMPGGSGLVWSTFYGGIENDHAATLALFPSGDIVFSGEMDTSVPPATEGAFDTVLDEGDDFLARLSADGTTVLFQTYFAGGPNDLLVVGQGIVFGGLAGGALPTSPNAFQPTLARGDVGSGFVAKLNDLGSELVWSTYLGGAEGAGTDSVNGLAVDAAGAVYVSGETSSLDFPVTPGAFDVSTSGSGDGFVAKLLASGTGLIWSTYISACCGGAVTSQWDLEVDSAGNAISVGYSNQPNFPTTPDAFQPAYIGSFPSSDAHLTKFDAFGEMLVYSTYFGGNGSDTQPYIGLDAGEDPLIGFRSGSSTIPTTPGAYDNSYAGASDSVAVRFDLSLLPWKVMGGGLTGSIDTPNLAGRGALTPGSPARLSVRGAAASSPASLIAGVVAANLPFKGGTMVPFPTIIVPLATNALGSLDLPFTWVSVPPGINLYVQIWIKDLGAATGFSATNALRMTSQ